MATNVADLMKEVESKDNVSDEKLKNTINLTGEYKKALLGGDTHLFDNYEKPLGTRYFIKRDEKKKNEDGSEVDTYYVVDNMKYGKTNGAIDMSKRGLLESALSNIQSVDPSASVREGFGPDDTTFVEITIEVDGTGKTETKEVSIRDYKNLDCTAFPDSCKKYKGMVHCDTCEKIEVSKAVTDLGDLSPENQKKMMQDAVNKDPEVKKMKGKLSNMAKAMVDEEGFKDLSGGIESFYTRYTQPITNFTQETISPEYSFEIEKIEEKNAIIKKDLVTTIWIGGFSVLLLIILAKQM